MISKEQSLKIKEVAEIINQNQTYGEAWNRVNLVELLLNFVDKHYQEPEICKFCEGKGKVWIQKHENDTSKSWETKECPICKKQGDKI